LFKQDKKTFRNGHLLAVHRNIKATVAPEKALE